MLSKLYSLHGRRILFLWRESLISTIHTCHPGRIHTWSGMHNTASVLMRDWVSWVTVSSAHNLTRPTECSNVSVFLKKVLHISVSPWMCIIEWYPKMMGFSIEDRYASIWTEPSMDLTWWTPSHDPTSPDLSCISFCYLGRHVK